MGSRRAVNAPDDSIWEEISEICVICGLTSPMQCGGLGDGVFHGLAGAV
jgi:hypothetical protein